MWGLVPIKRLSDAKQRLAPCLSPRERRALCGAMLKDVLTALSQAKNLAGITVAGDDPEVAAIAAAHGCEFLSERELEAAGVNPVVAAAVDRLARRGFDDVFIALSDVPMLTAGDISVLVETHAGSGDRAVTIATDRHHSGSNCLIASPAHLMEYHFGADSLRKHLASARRAGMLTNVLSRPRTALDIDTPDDLALLRVRLEREDDSATSRYLSSAGRSYGKAPADPQDQVYS